ncbi:MAG: DTW domain-containing protein YfiP [Bradymonadia bacterium]
MPLTLRTRVALVIHKREITRPTNTGRLSSLAFTNTSILVRGYQDAPADLSVLSSPDRRTLLLFPRDDARTLTTELLAEDERPVTLIVPDGNWGQARRCVQREQVMLDAEAVIPPAGLPTQYLLRKEHVLGGLATAEAIGRAMRILEGDAAGQKIEDLFHEKVRRSIARRPGGLPPQR